MRVLLISKALVVGQYQIKAEEIAKQRDVELTVVVPPSWRDERGVMPLERAHTNGYTLRVEPITFNGQFHFHFYPTLARVISETRPDLVHMDEEPYNLATFLALIAARRAGAKTIFFTWQNILRRYPSPFAWMESYVLGHSDYAIAGNSEALNVLRAKHYRGEASVLPQFGVDAEKFSPRLASRAREQFRIGYAGRLVEEKGVETLLLAVASLPGNWRVEIVGSGPDLPRLQALAHKLDIADHITFETWRPSGEMPAFYNQLDVLVQPSRTRFNWKEQFGRTLIEAMACGVPVITSDSGEMPNVIGDAGLIFHEDDPDQLRAHIEKIQADPTLGNELGQRGRARVLAQFTHAHIAQATCAIYRHVGARKKQS